MKKIYILGLSLISLIVLHLVINVSKNLLNNLDTNEGFDPKCTITNAASKVGKANRCQHATLEATRLASINRESKLKELENIVAKTKSQVLKNRKDIFNNIFVTKQMQNVSDDKDEDTSAACKNHPEAC